MILDILLKFIVPGENFYRVKIIFKDYNFILGYEIEVKETNSK